MMVMIIYVLFFAEKHFLINQKNHNNQRQNPILYFLIQSPLSCL